jgi:type IV fimbrial biogenesis protein FimT
MNRPARGFTLMELMFTIALAAVLMGLGVPAFREFVQNGRLTGAANEMLVTIVAARNEAVRRQAVVSFCPSANPGSDSATCDASATAGYISFVDEDADCQADAGDEIVANMSIHSEVKADANASCVSFAATGFRRVVPGQPTTALAIYCDTRGLNKIGDSDVTYARGVEILPTGRAAVSRVYSELTSWGSAADPVSCP